MSSQRSRQWTVLGLLVAVGVGLYAPARGRRFDYDQIGYMLERRDAPTFVDGLRLAAVPRAGPSAADAGRGAAGAALRGDAIGRGARLHRLIRCAKRKLRVAEIPCDEPRRIAGRAKLQPFRWGAAYMLQVLREIYFWR